MIVVKKFSAEWCSPCRLLKQTMNVVKSEIQGVNFIDIDVDDNPSVATEYKIRSIPVVIIEKNGTIVERLTGVFPKEHYIEKINSYR